MKRSNLSLFASVLALGLLSAPLGAERLRNHFDSDAAMRPPGFFDFEVLGSQSPANWLVLADVNPPSAPNQLTQTIASRPEGSVAVALRRHITLRDGVLSVALKRMPATAGIVFRMASEKDYLLLLLNCQTGEATLTSYRGGTPSALARGKARIDRDWGFLTLRLAGPSVSASWNEKGLLRATDPSPASGRAGLATEGPGNASFDEFVLDTGNGKP